MGEQEIFWAEEEKQGIAQVGMRETREGRVLPLLLLLLFGVVDGVVGAGGGAVTPVGRVDCPWERERRAEMARMER